MYDDINGIDTLMCPYCRDNYYLDKYEEHLEKCNSNSYKFDCPICMMEIQNNSKDEGYIEHILSFHDEYEIKHKIKNKNILNILGIDLQESEIKFNQKNIMSNEIPKTNTNNIISNINSNNFNNLPIYSQNLIKSDTINYKCKKISINSKNFATQCKLCQNIVLNNYDVLKQHLENLHNCFNFKESVINPNFGNNFEFIPMQNYSVCPKCGILVDDIDFLLKSHMEVYHKIEDNFSKKTQNNLNNLSNLVFELNDKNSNDNKNFYCHLCEIPLKLQHDEIQHIHSSFINLKTNPNDLLFYLNNCVANENTKNLNDFNPQVKIKKKFSNTSIFTDFMKNQKNNLEEKEAEIFPKYNKKSKIESNLNTSISQPKIIYNPDTIKNINNPFNYNQIQELNEYKSNSNEEYDKKFSDLFKQKIFDYVDILGRNDTLHYYKNNKPASSAVLLKRLKNEFAKLQDDLPCNNSSSFFVRADMSHPQFIKFLIAGSRGTPYEHGLFEFDIFIPHNYPNEPPKCQFITTGNGKIRFNPNLYDNGYVCLSLLGTWQGISIEKWDPKNSNLFQLILSLSSLVMNETVIIIEPGYEKVSLISEFSLINEGYCNVIKYGNLIYAMIEILKSPLPIFKDVIAEYFKFKEKEILSDLNQWIDRAKNTKYSYSQICLSHNNAICKLLESKGFEKLIELHLKELTQLLTNLNNLK